MPIYILDSDGSLIGWAGGGSAPDTTPPAAPTGLTAAPGDGRVTLTWSPNAEGDLASYKVRRAIPGSSVLVASVPAGTEEYVVTGLTNGTEYTFFLRAADAAGNVSPNSASVSATPSAAVYAPIMGYNTTDNNKAPLSSRLVKWANRAPMVRRYGGSQFLTSGTFGFTTAVCPERGLVFSVKANDSGAYTVAGLAAGNGNSRLKDWLESIPSVPAGQKPWKVRFGFWHEMNSGSGPEVNPTQFLNIYEQFRTAFDSAVLQPGVDAQLCVNFMAYKIGDGSTTGFDDSWVPDPSVCHQLTWDTYLNPGNFTNERIIDAATGQQMVPNCSAANGVEYCSSFPDTATRHREWMLATIRNGYGADGRWSIWELNGPPRDWDGPANPDYACGSNKRLRYQGGRSAVGKDQTHTEVARAQALKASIDYMVSRPTFDIGTLGYPEHILIWEHPEGVNWNQKFLHDNVWSALKPYFVASP